MNAFSLHHEEENALILSSQRPSRRLSLVDLMMCSLWDRSLSRLIPRILLDWRNIKK